ncbi:4-hydroxybutyrate CoA-transferase [Olavius algarvensis associated proteobacterium Delta 3]|nr:4-hydroxybutyrate CoA-transferase [Olavius algarvensis associated proteobacterium Delta 3]CAB5166754.1 4-hydroxybutyrate CoA-transferase [Olavius algarvensis associated proteobacterium Delta 3]
MIDAAAYDAIETLKNGIDVRIRSIRADDRERIIEAFRNLEPESIYTRFFHHKKALSDAELKSATEIDFDDVVVLVVTIGKEKNETIIAGGRYVAFDAADNLRSAEVAFTVEEDYQGQGLASHLLRHLAHIARQKGIARFEADVLPHNKAMLIVFSRCGLPMVKGHEAGNVHVTLTLTKK